MSFLVGVITFVHRQVRRPWESFLAEPAFVRLNAHVTSHVNHKVIVPDEAQPALWKGIKNCTKAWADGRAELTGTKIRLLVLMILRQVVVQFRFLRELLIAVLTRQALAGLAVVRLHVRPQILLRRERLLADVAHLFVFGSVAVLRLDVLLQMLLPDEALLALGDVALERLRVRVVAGDVQVQVVDAGEALVADRALNFALLVRQLVTLQMGRPRETFIALVALVELELRVVGVVTAIEGIHVAHQILVVLGFDHDQRGFLMDRVVIVVGIASRIVLVVGEFDLRFHLHGLRDRRGDVQEWVGGRVEDAVVVL